MKIEITCRDNDNYLRQVEVHALSFDPQKRSFSMAYCIGDDWGQVLHCPIACAPTSLQFQWERVSVRFEQEGTADQFGDWLIEAEAQVQHGLRTMRG